MRQSVETEVEQAANSDDEGEAVVKKEINK
jgi:hypothetical protein